MEANRLILHRKEPCDVMEKPIFIEYIDAVYYENKKPTFKKLKIIQG